MTTYLDGLGRTIGTLDSAGVRTRTHYNAEGRVDYESVAGFGTRSMRLTRLTNVAGVSCP